MEANVTTLQCPTPVGQPLPRAVVHPISAAMTSSCRNGGRGFSSRSSAAEAARLKLGKAARRDVDFILLRDTPVLGRWSWEAKPLPGKPAAARRADGLLVGSVEARMVDLALSPQGVTRPGLRETLGWNCDPLPSLIVACDKAGVILTVLKHGKGPFRYRGTYQGS